MTDKSYTRRCDGQPVGTPLRFKDAEAAVRYLARGRGARKSRRPLKHGRPRR